MTSFLTRVFWYGFGVSAGRAIFGEDDRRERPAQRGPVRQQTEEEIVADEKRYDADEKRYDADEKRRVAQEKTIHKK